MGRKGSWFSSIKKALTPRSKEKRSQKSETKVVTEEQLAVPDTSTVENATGSCDSHSFPPPEKLTPPELQAEPPQAASVTTATAVAAVSTEVAADTTQHAGKSTEEAAAIKLQTVFRGYLARRALGGLRGLARLKTVIEGPTVRRQTVNTLRSIQRLTRLQSRIYSRRFMMSEENQALRKQLVGAKEITNMQNGDEWNDSVQSKEEVEAKLLRRYEATLRRERAMAYSFSQQQPWRKSGGITNRLFMDPTNPRWGWSWSERYKDHQNDHSPIKSGINGSQTETAKSYASRQLNRLKGNGSPRPVASPKPKPGPNPWIHPVGLKAGLDDDSQSVSSAKSERTGMHSVVGSTVVDKSPKVDLWRRGATENGGEGTVVGNGGGAAKKRLSFQAKLKKGG